VRTKADNAKRAVEVLEKETGLEVRSDVAANFAKSPGYADHFRATANPDYSTAWAKIITHGEAGAILRMSDAERQAVERVATIEKREMSLVDSQGGFAVPGAVDPQILLNSTGSVSSLRDLARKVSAVSDTFRTINSAGIQASFVAEGVEVTDDSPAIGSALITAHKAASFVSASFEILGDWPSMVEQIRFLFTESKNELEAEKFLYGSGTSEPFGMLTRLEANTAADVAVTTSGTIGAVDIYNLAAALGPRFRPNAGWMASMSVLNQIRSISDDSLGNYIADLRQGYALQLLGRPVYEASPMDEMVSTTASKTFVAFGDFERGYTIFDRLGSGRVSVVPHLFGTTNGRPIGASGLYYYWRVGGDVLTGSTSGECGVRILTNPAA
jgi:HK97 family phage major capsid protein